MAEDMLNGETKKLQVAFFMDSFFPIIDGVSYVMDMYAKDLVKHNIEVTIFVPIIEGYDDSKSPYKVYRCKSKPWKMIGYELAFPRLDKKFLSELKELHFDLVHIHSPFNMGKFGLKFARKRKIPCIATAHTQFRQDFYKFTKSKLLSAIALKIIMRVFNGCEEVWSMNTNCEKMIREYGYKGKYREMNNGTEMLPFTDENRHIISEVESEYSLKGQKNIFIFVGRIVKQKNIFFIVDCLKKLKDGGLDFKMIFVGDGLEKKKLTSYVEENKLTDRVIFTGVIRDRLKLGALYALAKLQLFPSKYDTNALVQVEAATFSTPTIFIDGSVTTAFVKNNVNGFLALDSVDEFAGKINEICNDDELYGFVRDNCFPQLYLNWNTVAEKVAKSYHEIVDTYNLK